jgi:nucleotide-binding universal stress UspA family protein
MKLLIGYDASAGSRAALQDLKNAGLPESGEALVIGIADFFIPPTPPESPFSESEQAALIARQQAEQSRTGLLQETQAAALQLKETLCGWTIHGEAAIDAPAWGLLKRADEWKPDLICLGAPHSSRLERLFFGSICQKVVSHAEASVRIGRPVPASGPLRLLLAMDGSPDARAAADAIAARRWPAGTEVCVVAVRDSRFAAFTGALLNPLYGEAGDTLSAEITASLQSAGLTVSTELLDGKPAAALLEKAEAWQAHCLFAGASGHTVLERLVLGSVSSALAARACCSVEIIRRRNA